MKKLLIKQIKNLTKGVALGLYLSSPVFAADIEIYTDSNGTATTAQPNVMFIMDSSDSMRRLFTSGSPIQDPYDPTKIYGLDWDTPGSGNIGPYDATYFYYNTSGIAPTGLPDDDFNFKQSALKCDHAFYEYAGNVRDVAKSDNGTPDDGDPLNGDETADDFSYYVRGPLSKPGITATAGSGLVTSTGTGIYGAQLAQYETQGQNSWQALSTDGSGNPPADETYTIECKVDAGLHGETDADAHKYINDNNNDGFGASQDSDQELAVWPDAATNFYYIYHPNYLNYKYAPPTSSTGLSLFQMLKNAISTIVASASNINIGYAVFDSATTDDVDGIWVDEDGDTVVDNGETGTVSGSGAGGEGGAVQYPAEDVNAGRQNFYTGLKTLDASGDATLSETYYEVLKYFGGEDVDYGTLASPPLVGAATETGSGNKIYQTPITESCQKNYIVVVSGGLSTFDYVNSTRRGTLNNFDATSCNNDTYDSSDTNRNAATSDTSTNDNCLDEFASWAKNEDIARRDETDSGTSPYEDEHAGFQSITTYTVGFAFQDQADLTSDEWDEQQAAQKLLEDTAEKGGGEFITADDEDGLVQALNALLSNILKVNSTFSSPAVSVNAFNRSTHLNDLYFTLFKPDEAEHWIGNLKKYKLLFDTDGVPFIADQNGNQAVSSATGFFNDSSKSYWSDSIDGDEAGEGGAAGLIGNTFDTPARKVYTITGSYTDGTGRTAGVFTADEPDLTATANRFNKANTDVTYKLLGFATDPDIATPGYLDNLIDWANGDDVLDEVSGSYYRRAMGDPLHAEPALIQYGQIADGSDPDSDPDPDLVSYVATNDGYLHAIDARDASPNDSPSDIGGTELWSFIPQELLVNLDGLYKDDGSIGKIYGIDGSVVPWIVDVDGDGTIEAADGDKVYIYFGMRRGLENWRKTNALPYRNHIYALDVTDRNNPKFLWKIDAGTGTDGTGAYDEIGQTWSTINVETIKVGDADHTVLMFGGGYDVATQDGSTTREAAAAGDVTGDDHGRAFYIADATTGEKLWSAGPPTEVDTAPEPDVKRDLIDHDLEIDEMQYSIPGRVKPLDVDGDGYIDRVYFGDMGGQIWRFDIALGTEDTKTASSDDIPTELQALITGGVFANLATDGDAAENRRFFYPPDVAIINEQGRGAYLAILAGSGFRAHPLQTATHDRIFMIRDEAIYDLPTYDHDSDPDTAEIVGYEAVTISDLYDATDNLVTEAASAADREAALNALAAAEGYYIDLDEESDGSWVGEKSLSEPLIFNGIGIVTTYLPPDAGYQSADICKPNDGAAAIYYINIADGTPTYSSTDEVGVRGDRRTILKRGGIPPTPTVITTEEGDALCAGTECETTGVEEAVVKTYWYEIENSSSISFSP